MIVDEGELGIQDVYGSRFALPSTGEKGYIYVVVDLSTVGGHSSVPPRHTTIGIMADLITEIEKEDYPLDISLKSPYFYQLQCEAKSARFMDPKLRSDIKRLRYDESAKNSLFDKVVTDLTTKALVSTTQAIDVVNGGLKVNALPEKVVLMVNHRVSYKSSLEEVKRKITKLVTNVADKYSLDVEAFGDTLKCSNLKFGNFLIYSDSSLIPAPTTNPFENPT